MADELSSNWVTVRYNEEKLLNFTLVRRKELITYQVESKTTRVETDKCGVQLNEDYWRISEDSPETLRTLVIKAKASELNETEQDCLKSVIKHFFSI